MEQFKKIQVIMLSIEKNPSILWDKVNNELKLPFKDYNQSRFEEQHLYFLSDDKIEEGNWCIYKDKYIVQIKEKDPSGYICSDNCKPLFHEVKKIIATTDTSLQKEVKGVHMSRMFSLPQPSQQFIEKYVESYNAGSPITEVLEVLVEYEQISKKTKLNMIMPDGDIKSLIVEAEYKLKVNPDNTINIKSSKDSWNRKEVIELINKSYEIGLTNGNHKIGTWIKLDNWIKENL